MRARSVQARLYVMYNTLQKISYPCIIIVRVSAQSLSLRTSFLYEKIKNENMERISGALEIKDKLPEIVEIIDLTKYDGIDYN